MTQLTNAQLQERLDKSPSAVRVTEHMIQERIKSVEYIQLRNTITLCSIALDNGYSVRGESACVDPANFNRDIGETLAYQDAFRKLWPLFGFLVAELTYRATLQDADYDSLVKVGVQDGE